MGDESQTRRLLPDGTGHTTRTSRVQVSDPAWPTPPPCEMCFPRHAFALAFPRFKPSVGCVVSVFPGLSSYCSVYYLVRSEDIVVEGDPAVPARSHSVFLLL
jgi:hypothetical protein